MGTLDCLLWKPKGESDRTNVREHSFWATGEEAELVRKPVNEADFQRMGNVLALLTGDGASRERSGIHSRRRGHRREGTWLVCFAR